MINSDLSLHDVLFETNMLEDFGCIKVIINGEIIHDDDLSAEEWIPFEESWKEYIKANPWWKDYVVSNVSINITSFHHSIISIYCYMQI